MLCVITSNCDFLKAVEETFEQELHQAIMLSKLAYEEQLVVTAKSDKEQEPSKKPGKKSKKATMSLEEFNSLGSNAVPNNTVPPPEPEDVKPKGNIIFCSRNIRTVNLYKGK